MPVLMCPSAGNLDGARLQLVTAASNMQHQIRILANTMAERKAVKSAGAGPGEQVHNVHHHVFSSTAETSSCLVWQQHICSHCGFVPPCLHLHAEPVLLQSLQQLQPGDTTPALTPAAAYAETLMEVDRRACQQLQALVLVLSQGTYLATPLLLLVALRFGQLPNILLQVLWCKGLDDYVMRAQLLQEVSYNAALTPCAAPMHDHAGWGGTML